MADQSVAQAQLVQLHLCQRPVLPHRIGHLNGAALRGSVGAKAQIRRGLADDVAHNGGRNARSVVVFALRIIQHGKHHDLRVINGQHRQKAGNLAVVAVVAAQFHIQLFTGAGFAADAIACHIGISARVTGLAAAHHIFHHRAHLLAHLLADHLTLDLGFNGFHGVAVCIHDMIHHMRRDQIAAVYHRRGGSDHLQRRDFLSLTKGRAGQLDLAHFAVRALFFGRVIQKIGRFAGQIDAGGFSKAKGVEIIVKARYSQCLAGLDEIHIARIVQCLFHLLHSVHRGGAALGGSRAGVADVAHLQMAAAVKRAVGGHHAAVQCSGCCDQLEHRAGIIKLGDGFVFPLCFAEGFAELVILLVALGGFQLLLIACIINGIGIVGVKIRLAGHSQNRAGIHIHDHGAAAILHIVAFNGSRKIALHDLLQVHINGQHKALAILCGMVLLVLLTELVFMRIGQADGAAILPGQYRII